jgi:hypothetical protein
MKKGSWADVQDLFIFGGRVEGRGEDRSSTIQSRKMADLTSGDNCWGQEFRFFWKNRNSEIDFGDPE